MNITIEDLQRSCMALPGTTEDIKWEHHLCFNIGGKMYLITSPDETPSTASFKVTEEEFDTLIARDGFAPTSYLARYKWVRVDDINRLTIAQWKYYIGESYRLVASKLPLKVKKSLGII